MHSPKNKFFAEINFTPSIKELGSVVSLGAMTLEDVEYLATQEAQRIISNSSSKAYIVIRENMAAYPKFDWVQVKKYTVG